MELTKDMDIDGMIVTENVRKAVRHLKNLVSQGDGSPRTVMKESVEKWIDISFPLFKD